jgi:hypothetical protein
MITLMVRMFLQAIQTLWTSFFGKIVKIELKNIRYFLPCLPGKQNSSYLSPHLFK